MGMFKQMKDMKKTVEAAPGMIDQAQQMGQQAQEMAAAQQAAAQQQAAQAQQASEQAAQAGGPDFEPVAGVSLEVYADVCKELAAQGYDQSKAAGIAASKGISADSWQQAMDGWTERMKRNLAVGQRFNALYRGG
jgi:hypothetical protein